jgi:hypothetical protein
MAWCLVKHRDFAFYTTCAVAKASLNKEGNEVFYMGFILYGPGIFLFSTVSKPALGLSQPPIQWVPGDLSLGVKRSGREVHHSPTSSAEFKNAWSCTSAPQYAFMAWCTVKAQGQLYLSPLLLPCNVIRQRVRKICIEGQDLDELNLVLSWVVNIFQLLYEVCVC